MWGHVSPHQVCQVEGCKASVGQVEEGNHGDSLNYGCIFITSDVGGSL